jgi:hypothetical protein
MFRDLGDRSGIVASVEQLATVALASGFAGRSAYLWGATDRIRRELGLVRAESDGEAFDRHVAAGRNALGDEAFDAEWGNGAAATLEDVVGEALGR